MPVYDDHSFLLGASASKSFVPPIQQSLIFDSTSYFRRTPGVASNRTTWTWTAWVRFTSFNTNQYIFVSGAASAGGLLTGLTIDPSSTATLWWNNASGGVTSSNVLRDTGWYHLALVANVTTLTLYVNGVQFHQRAISGAAQINNNVIQSIGERADGTGSSLKGAMADVHFLDGVALTPAQIQSTFLEDWNFDGQTIPAPKKVTGLTYGTNGFHLDFANSAAFGTDRSGNGNDWAPTGFVAGDQTADVPGRLYNIINPLEQSQFTIGDAGFSFSRGGAGSNVYGIFGSLLIPSGKWYWEMTATVASGTNNHYVGIARQSIRPGSANNVANSWLWSNGNDYVLNGVVSNSGITYQVNGDVVMFAYDADTGKLWFGKNGVWNGSGNPSTGANPVATVPAPTVNDLRIAIANTNNGGAIQNDFNFGQRSYTYTPPTGFSGISTDLFQEPEYSAKNWFDINLRTGTNSLTSITSTPFRPNFLFTRLRNQASSFVIIDSVRGVKKELYTNLNIAEQTSSTNAGLMSFDEFGYTLGTDNDTNSGSTNTSGDPYVDWILRTDTATTVNNNGSISSTVSVAEPGHFSIVKWLGNNGAATIGHGLPGAPEMIIQRWLSATNWNVYHKDIGNTAAVFLNLFDGQTSSVNYWNNTSPTSSVFSVAGSTNLTTPETIAYCFRSVPGICKIGSWVGNASTDGPFVYLGFKPRWILWKITATGNWYIYDAERSPGNGSALDFYLNPNLANAENTVGGFNTTEDIDFVNNGFKIRDSGGDVNNSGSTYIYIAIADVAGGGSLPWPLAR